MIIEGYNITLNRLQFCDLELVRMHRNSEVIQQYMEYDQYITRADQERWFTSINNKSNNYFLITSNNKKIGLIYGAEVNWQVGQTGNGGVFIWDEEYLETDISVGASLLLTELSFLIGFNHIYIKVRSDNKRATNFNINLGYKVLDGQESILNQKYLLTKAQFYKKTKWLRQYFVTRYTDLIILRFNNPNDELEANWITACSNIAEAEKKRIKIIIG